MKKEIATFAAGCFWGVEETFRIRPGVVLVRSGYSGGHMKNPAYEDVCSGKTGHAECVEIVFDPKKISYSKLLDIFFKCHDPTTPNRQGPDVGSQYRSAIFYHSQTQKKLAMEMIKAIEKSKRFSRPIVTEITKATKFYPAEEYHQKYVQKNPFAFCHVYRGD